MKIQRVWAMPSADTFDCPPIGAMVKRYLMNSEISIDPFARNKRWAAYTNDLNPETAAEYHLSALEFLRLMLQERITEEKNLCYEILEPGGHFLHFGYHSNGMGKKRDMVIEEILLVAHGRSHNDTICMAERKLAHQSNFLP